jgi:hypothetical protein
VQNLLFAHGSTEALQEVVMFDQSRRRRQVQALALAVVLAAVPALASAGTYVLTLRSGAKFESRYKPTVAGWDANKVMILAESGNWVALSRADVESVRSTTESRGLGFVINNSTIALGWAPNDNLTPEQEAAAAEIEARNAVFAPQQQNYSVNQFVEPGATQGIPSGLIGQ